MKPGSGSPTESARRLARRLLSLEEGTVRSRAAARMLAAIPAKECLPVITALARDESLLARVALAAVARAFIDPEPFLPYGWRADLFEAAVREGAEEVAALLLEPPPKRKFEEPLDRSDPHLAHLTRGHKKAFARAKTDPDLLDRLAAEGDPLVVNELLKNPQITEPFVVRLAARRPCRPATLRCLVDSSRWRNRPAVAVAIAKNPYAEPGLAVKILPGLSSPDLAGIARDETVHPLVRGMAEQLRVRGRRGDLGVGLSVLRPGALSACGLATTLEEATERVAQSRNARRDEHQEHDENDDDADLHHDGSWKP